MWGYASSQSTWIGGIEGVLDDVALGKPLDRTVSCRLR